MKSSEEKSLAKPGWLRAWFAFQAPIFLILLVAVEIGGGRQGFTGQGMFFSGQAAYLILALFFSVGLTVPLLLLWFICWRSFKRCFFVLACFATLIALLYAEEDWRGWHNLKKFEREWEAKGEKFSFAEFVPPTVPDEQNFALTPIVASSYARMLDKTGHEIRPRNTNVVNRLMMRTTFDANLVPSPENSGYWARGTASDLKVWQDYYRALAAKTNAFAISSQPQTPAQGVLLALSKYDADIEELWSASRLPFSRFPLEYDKDNPAEILLPHLAAMKAATKTLQLRALAELQNGDGEKALADVKLMLYLGQSIRTEPVLISHLVCLAMTDITLQPIYDGLAARRWSDAQLAALDVELSKLDFLAEYQFAMRGERIFGISIIEYLRRTRNLHSFEIEETSFTDDTPGKIIFYLLPAGFFYQNELSIARLHQQWTLPLVNLTNRIVPPAVVAENNAAMDKEFSHFSISKFFARLIFPAVSKSINKFARLQISVDLARVAIALERHRLAHGEFPETLAPLAPAFLEKIPHDVINGEPLHYRRTDDGQFVLYSVGWNTTDDGGTVVLTKSTTPSIDYMHGDIVWRYPKK